MKISKPRTVKGLATFLAQIAEEKVAENIVIADLTELEFAPCDYFVFCSCDSEAQMRAVVNEINIKTGELDMDKPTIEGLSNAQWIIADMFSVVMHIMRKETRQYYQIEKIWGDALFYTLSEKGSLIKLKDFSYLS
ncbi:MAG: ribosome silencing factor [Candidatus Kapabacteria bacterium]|nr:ribosome silencing factor [Candidatus Kapabacteria bacterium]